jgi:arginine deiminase
MRAVFRHPPQLAGPLCFDGTQIDDPAVSLEGGDVQMLREDLLVIGHSERTSVAGIDRLATALAARGKVRDVIVVILPHSRAAIHLDMVFTMIDHELCVVYEPLIVNEPRCRAIRLSLEGGHVVRIHDHDGLLDALAAVGLPLEPVSCGGDDPVRQEREQWSSGANFFTFAPGKIIGYGRNAATFEALGRRGFRLVDADAVASGEIDLSEPGRVAVAMSGAESSRGGGGCRCMTLPVLREPVAW